MLLSASQKVNLFPAKMCKKKKQPNRIILEKFCKEFKQVSMEKLFFFPQKPIFLLYHQARKMVLKVPFSNENTENIDENGKCLRGIYLFSKKYFCPKKLRKKNLA